LTANGPGSYSSRKAATGEEPGRPILTPKPPGAIMFDIVVFAAMVLIVFAVMLALSAPVAGFLLVVDSLLGLMFGAEPFFVLLWLVAGATLWLFSHLAIAHFNDGFWRSRFAELVFRLPGLRALRPTW
jgi:hypothetical protein